MRNTRREDFEEIAGLSRAVYPDAPPWNPAQLGSHLDVFPEGQFVAVDSASGRLVGMASSLIILWDDYDMAMDWRDFTEHGMFTNHDPEHGRTLYGAEIIVHPALQGRGIGKQLYRARRGLVQRLGLLRVRAGARLRGYHRHADRLLPEAYVIEVVHGRLVDLTLTFQLRQGFEVIAVVEDYLRHDPESLGHAAVIEWLNPDRATPEDWERRDTRFLKPTSRRAPREP